MQLIVGYHHKIKSRALTTTSCHYLTTRFQTAISLTQHSCSIYAENKDRTNKTYYHTTEDFQAYVVNVYSYCETRLYYKNESSDEF